MRKHLLLLHSLHTCCGYSPLTRLHNGLHAHTAAYTPSAKQLLHAEQLS
jgi:hypothetical protein